MNVEDHDWIGLIYRGDVKANVTFITPLAYYTEGIWKSLTSDVRRQWFPNNGRVAFFKKDTSDISVGRLWMFRPEQSTQLSATMPGNSRFLISYELVPAPTAQVLNWEARTNNALDVPDLLIQGIAAPDCYCQRIYIYCQSRLFGPIRLDLDNSRYKPREYIQSSNTGGQPLFVSMYTKPENDILIQTDTHQHITLLDENFLGTPIGKEDWSLPQVTIKQVLIASNEALEGVDGSVHLVDKRIRELVRLSSGEGSQVFHLDPTTLKRARYILANQVDRMQALRGMVEQLSAEHPIVKIAREIEVQSRSQEIERGVAVLVQKQQKLLEHLQSENQLAQEKLDQLQIAAEEMQKNQQEAIVAMNAFEQAVHERLASLKEEPLRMLAEHHVTASLLPMLLDGSAQPTFEKRIPSYSTGAQDSTFSMTQEIASISGLKWGKNDGDELIQVPLHELQLKRWSHVAQQMGANAKDIRVCVAALLAGLIPALYGDAAIATLGAVAQIIAQGRMEIAPVPLTALTTLDLLGTIDSHHQVFLPLNGLADCILEAQAYPDELVIVVLEGIDRVPGMPTYMPFLRQFIETRQHVGCAQQIRPVNLFHPRALVKNDSYLKLAAFTLPHNILLATTLDDDFNSLAIPSAGDHWIVRRKTDLKVNAVSINTKGPVYSSVSFERWSTWKEEVRTNSANRVELNDHLDQRQRLFNTAMDMLGIKEPDKVLEHAWPDQFEQYEEEGK